MKILKPRLADAAAGSNGSNTCIALLEPNFGAKNDPSGVTVCPRVFVSCRAQN
jgi:hypothetical protein